MAYFSVVTESVDFGAFETLAEAKACVLNDCAPDEDWSIRGWESEDAYEEGREPFYDVSLYDIAEKFLLGKE